MLDPAKRLEEDALAVGELEDELVEAVDVLNSLSVVFCFLTGPTPASDGLFKVLMATDDTF